MKCYYFKEIKFHNYLFNYIDICYIIHLENNGRLNFVLKQLYTFKPCKKNIIVFNKGFKKCKKLLLKQQSNYDLVDANIKIMKHAQQNNYNNIMILEDDFFFDKDIKNHNKNIDEFIYKKQNEKMIYSFGIIPHLVIPYNYNHYLMINGIASHCIILNKLLINDFLKLNFNYYHEINKYAIDEIYQKSYKYNRYIYYKPLIYQLFTETDNSKNWNKIFYINILYFYRLLNLHKKAQPGYNIFYFLSKINLLLLIIFITYILY